jgi:type VII secretion-associated serine protease mycosin
MKDFFQETNTTKTLIYTFGCSIVALLVAVIVLLSAILFFNQPGQGNWPLGLNRSDLTPLSIPFTPQPVVKLPQATRPPLTPSATPTLVGLSTVMPHKATPTVSPTATAMSQVEIANADAVTSTVTLPERQPEAMGPLEQRDGNSLFIRAGFGSDTTTEVVITADTAIYRDNTVMFQSAGGPGLPNGTPPSGGPGGGEPPNGGPPSGTPPSGGPGGGGSPGGGPPSGIPPNEMSPGGGLFAQRDLELVSSLDEISGKLTQPCRNKNGDMKQKLSIGLTLLLLVSLVRLASSFINIEEASANTMTPCFNESSSVKIGVSRQIATQVSTYTLYLPVIFHGLCASSFSYNETIRYNLAKIGVEKAWQSCFHGEGITVAVIDTGVDLDHPDLQANLVAGKSFVSGVSSADDDYGHGTHMAGIIAGVNNNGGIIGVAPKASIMPVKVLDKTGSGSMYDVASGIEWATDQGAQVINLSLGSVSNSAVLKAAVDYAYNQGVLVVAAGGNCGDSSYYLNGCYYQDQPVYPGAYANVMAVASTDSSDNQSSFSNQGRYIEIAAPGSDIYSTYLSGSYTTMSGTSMATPHVAGLAALIWSQNPNWTNAQVRAQIRNATTDLGTSGWDSQFGYGRINAAEAMGVSQTTSTTTDTFSTDFSPANTETTAAYIPGEILLKFRAGYTVSQVLDQVQVSAAEVEVAGVIDQIGVQKLAVTPGQEQVLLAQLLSSSGVEYAELNYVMTIR